jgi:DNA-binding XRE family transcriptional regulator
MKEHTNHQIITGEDGNPLFAVIPYSEYIRLLNDEDERVIFPNEVVELIALQGFTSIKAWRRYKKLSQKEMAERIGITQAAYSQMEKPNSNLKMETLKKIAGALGVGVEHISGI